jgi:hypothetical protein
LFDNVGSDGLFLGRAGLGRSSQETRDSFTLLTFDNSETIIEDENLVLGNTSLGKLLVVKETDRGVVDGGVDEDGVNFLVATSTDASVTDTECLGRRSERRVSRTSRGGLLQNFTSRIKIKSEKKSLYVSFVFLHVFSSFLSPFSLSPRAKQPNGKLNLQRQQRTS